MDEDPIWTTISNAGIQTRPDFSDPARWVSAARGRQYGPFDTREEALAAAIRGLVSAGEQADQREEQHARERWLWGLFG